MAESIQVWINHQITDLPVGAHLLDAIEQAQVKPPFAAAVNLQFVPRSQYASHTLQAGDKIELISPITGG
jgi:sulfur carrier protein